MRVVALLRRATKGCDTRSVIEWWVFIRSTRPCACACVHGRVACMRTLGDAFMSMASNSDGMQWREVTPPPHTPYLRGR